MIFMDNAILIKQGRDLLLQLHKMLVDFEREGYEMINGAQSSGQFLTLLLDNEDFAWLKQFSNLIVSIDEMLAQKDGVPAEMIDAELARLRKLVAMDDAQPGFISKYRYALQESSDIAGKHAELKALLAEDLS